MSLATASIIITWVDCRGIQKHLFMSTVTLSWHPHWQKHSPDVFSSAPGATIGNKSAVARNVPHVELLQRGKIARIAAVASYQTVMIAVRRSSTSTFTIKILVRSANFVDWRQRWASFLSLLKALVMVCGGECTSFAKLPLHCRIAVSCLMLFSLIMAAFSARVVRRRRFPRLLTTLGASTAWEGSLQSHCSFFNVCIPPRRGLALPLVLYP